MGFFKSNNLYYFQFAHPSIRYQLNFVKNAQEIFCNARKAPLTRGRKGFRRMNGHSTFSGCLISVFVFSTFDIWNHICVGSSITLGILAHFRHFSGLSGLGYIL